MSAKSSSKKLTFGTRGSLKVETCQVCDSKKLESVLFVGYLPPVNEMPLVGTAAEEQPAYPAQLLRCQDCQLFQLGLVVDPRILFPPSYPYTSGTTRILRENFAELSREVAALFPLASSDLVVDIGSNDGTLLENFQKAGNRVLGIEPTNASKIAEAKGIPCIVSFFNRDSAAKAVAKSGKAKIITAANCFAHIEDIHEIVASVLSLLDDKGIFITESHYLLSLLETIQYDTIYHEHLRYYSVTSLKHLFDYHGLEIIHVKQIPTHGGSVRVYAARKGQRPVNPSVAAQLAREAREISPDAIQTFKRREVQSKLDLLGLLAGIKAKGQKVYGIGAPSRASTLINYVGLDDGIVDAVVEIKGSYKIGKYVPGTLIPIFEESRLMSDQPEYALLLSWHIADELMPKLRASGFKGKFIVPLPNPRIVDGAHVQTRAA